MNRQFKAVIDGRETAFVSIDVNGDPVTMCIYELLVEPLLRSRGAGTAIVRRCIELAREENCERIAVIPLALEEGISEERLHAWYTRMGFVPAPDQNDLLEIAFT